MRNGLTRLRGQLERRSGYAARSRLLDKRGRGTLKKSTKARGGGVGTASFSTEEDVEGCVEEGGPVAGGPPVNVEGPGKRIGSVDGSRGAGLRTCSAGTLGPRPDQVHG